MQLTETNNSFIQSIIKEIDSPDITLERAFEILEQANAAKYLGTKLFNYVKDRTIQIAQIQLELDFEQALQIVAENVVQFEFNLGIKWLEEKPALNPADKSTGIVTIEATHASFLAWDRKMADEVQTWDTIKLRRALELLEPMEKKAIELRALIYMQEEKA